MQPPASAILRCGLERNLRPLNWALIAAANLALCVLVAASPPHPIYDEPWFLDTLALLKQHDLTLDFLRAYPGAPGPTFTLVYAAFDALFHPSFPGARFFNVALLFAAAVLMARTLVLTRTASAALLAGSFTLLPTVGVSAGMVLTEVPAAFFMTGALLLLTRLMTQEGRFEALTCVVCGLCIAAAVIGRQNYLVFVPCLLLAIRWPAGAPDRRDAVRIAAIIFVVALFVVPLFVFWGGPLPPQAAADGAGLSLPNGVRSAGYAGVIAFLVAPQIYGVMTARRSALTAVALFGIVAAALMDTPTVPMASMLTAFLSGTLIRLIGVGFNVALGLSAAAFLICFSIYLWQQRLDWFTRVTGSAALLGILSNAKITHQFSSRYVFVFISLLVLALAPAVRPAWHQPLRLALGAGLSLGALASYYFVR